MSELVSKFLLVFQSSIIGPIIAVMALLFCLNFLLSDCEAKVGLVVANTLITNTYVWNLVTSCFYEKYVWKLLFNVSWLFSIAEKMEISSFEQFGLYFAFSILASTIGASIYCLAAFFASGSEEFLTRPMYGSNGVCMVLLMFLRQRYRNDRIYSRIPYITYHNAPIFFIGYQILMAAAGFQSQWSDLCFTTIALFFSWSYLRFYYRYAETEPLGDKTDDFSFVAMFPEVSILVINFFLPIPCYIDLYAFCPTGSPYYSHSFHNRLLQYFFVDWSVSSIGNSGEASPVPSFTVRFRFCSNHLQLLFLCSAVLLFVRCLTF
jgi:membrane associated rhomboid family serine protease